jgi:hypothetical protein
MVQAIGLEPLLEVTMNRLVASELATLRRRSDDDEDDGFSFDDFEEDDEFDDLGEDEDEELEEELDEDFEEEYDDLDEDFDDDGAPRRGGGRPRREWGE